MKKLNLLFVLLLGLIVSFSACKSDDDNNGGVKTADQYLTGASAWKITAGTISPAVEFNGMQITDYYAFFMQDCEKDNFLTFSGSGTTGTFVEDEGAVKCNESDPQTENGTWEFLENYSKLKIVEGSDIMELNVVSIDASKIVVSGDNVEAGVTYTVTYTLTAQ